MAEGCICSIDVDYDPDCVAEDSIIGIRIAKEEYKCYECGRKIEILDKYEVVHAKWPHLLDGTWETTRICMICVEIRDCYFCTYVYGSMWEDFQLYIEEEGDVGICKLDALSPAARRRMIQWLDEYFIQDDLMEEEE